ncbi:heterokaryon incompatibility protein-domain-containing protein [Pyronema domesticum]|nr:heterokaryon incompatibility protein-domain-containing protein [Pyronema domesticum]
METTSIPRYLAISHSWAENLFDFIKPFPDTLGAEILRAIDTGIEYVWIDTYCIDQSDPEDKARQIPMMGEIYGAAEGVVVVLGTNLGITQEEVDEVVGSVWLATWAYEEEMWGEIEGMVGGENDEELEEIVDGSMDILSILAKTQWAKRIWTLQEYVLAQEVIWIGSDKKPVKLDESWIIGITGVFTTMFLGKHEEVYEEVRKLIPGMAAMRQKKIDSTRIMEFANFRNCSVPEDSVYGLMAAAGVVIEPRYGEGSNEAWRRWWEMAINKGHIRWALMPAQTQRTTLSVEPEERGLRNCIMPNFEVQSGVSTASSIDKVTAFRPASCERGVVSMRGRTLGSVKSFRLLGEARYVTEDFMQDELTLITLARGKLEYAMSVVAAFGGGRYFWCQRVLLAYVLVTNYRSALECIDEHDEAYWATKMGEFLDEDGDAQITIDDLWKDFLQLSMETMSGLQNCTAYLVRVETPEYDTHVIMATAQRVQLDLSFNYELVDFNAQTASGRSVTMVLQSKKLDDEISSQHKLGMVLPMIVTEDLNEAKKYASLYLSDPHEFKEYRIGGEDCAVCRVQDEWPLPL